MKLESLCLFCGSNRGGRPEYAEAARQLGAALAEQGLTLVYGAGKIGLMGVAADAALAAGGRVVGVIPEFLQAKEVAHHGLDEIHITQTMHERKAMMAERADGFIALPGGLGTFDELFEILTWGQLSVHSKPVGLLNVAGFFDPLLAMVRHAMQEGFMREENLSLFVVADNIDGLLAGMRAYQPRQADNKWLELSRT